MSETSPKPRPGSRRIWSSALGLIAAAALAVGVNMLADRLAPRARVDLTQQHLYTLSDGTVQTLRNLHDPITLRLFYSRRLGAAVPSYGSYAERVRAMLDEYVALSGGKIRLEVLDPEPFSETEDRALAYGLQGVPVDQSGEQIYFGLAGTNLLDDERSIPFFQPDRERFLEFDLTRLVYELSSPRRPVVGVMSTLPVNGDPRMMMMMRGGPAPQPFAVMQTLRQFFSVQDVPLDTQRIPDEVQVLMVVHPQNLSDATQYAIDQFVMRGGKLIAFVDPYSEGQASRPGPGGRPPANTASQLNRLLNAWGIDAPSEAVVLDLRGAWRVRANPNDRVQAVDYLAWFNMQGDSLNDAEVATAQLNQVTVAAAGYLRRRDGATIDFTPLLQSSERSMLANVERVRDNPDPARILAEFRPENLHRTIAARVRGEVPSAFPDGPPPPPEGTERPADFPAHLARSNGPANFVVIADADILEDRFWVRVQDFFGQQVATPFSDNGNLVANLVDMFAGGDALISLRSRGDSIRPFVVVDDIRRDADARFRQTERDLTERLQQTERRLRELRQGQGGQAGAVITPEQRTEIDAARAQILQTRQQLRAVQLDMRRDIEGVETWLRIINIAAVPVLLAAFAIGLGIMRARRRSAARS
ncbi:GldG family protein [Roseomonas sp. HJA6]|uniref:GldG family protein n=1 Tax=Roseomonas alba TaxID=2846776 RepID=A0ABS7A5S5_9PROT|nr:Gldg family protein [Neoroseomonas alba]MBW6397638.1 GldG family protein [Neoroseomonas alba]